MTPNTDLESIRSVLSTTFLAHSITLDIYSPPNVGLFWSESFLQLPAIAACTKLALPTNVGAFPIHDVVDWLHTGSASGEPKELKFAAWSDDIWREYSLEIKQALIEVCLVSIMSSTRMEFFRSLKTVSTRNTPVLPWKPWFSGLQKDKTRWSFTMRSYTTTS